MPETRQVELTEIDPPSTPARQAMDDAKLAELAVNMRDMGLMQAIGVVAKDGRYEIEYGHRRYTCAQMLGWRTIECKIYQPAEIASGAAMLAENIYHEELSAAEEALLFQEHRELYKLDEDGLCARFKKSPDYIGDRLRLFRGDEKIFHALLAKQINFSVARILNTCDDVAHRRYLLDVAVRTGYSAAVMADHVRQWRVQNVPKGPQVTPVASPEQPAAPPAFVPTCCVCGGDRDPWAMESVYIHKLELAEIRRVLKQAALAET